MPTLADQTQLQLRQAVGRNLQGNAFIVSTTTVEVDSSSVLDTVRLYGGNNTKNGKWVRSTSGTNLGETRRANDFVQGTAGTSGSGNHDITVAPAFSNTVPNAMGYELWLPEFHPDDIDSFLNDAIIDVVGRAYNPVELLSLHTGGGGINSNTSSGNIPRTGGTTRYDIPAGIDAISRIEYRASVAAQLIHSCEVAFDETVNGGFTVTTDTTIKRRGNASTKFVYVSASGANGNLVSDAISSVNISDKSHVEFWIYVLVTTVAGDLVLSLDNTAGHGSPIETLSLPAITADTWTFVRLALANPEDDTAIISVALEYNANHANNTIWLDDIQAVDEDTSIWDRLSSRGWWIEKGTSDLLFTRQARADLGYTLLKLVGGDSPALMTSDTDVCEIDNWYVVCRATELGALSAINVNPTIYGPLATTWKANTIQAKKSLHRMRGARKVS